MLCVIGMLTLILHLQSKGKCVICDIVVLFGSDNVFVLLVHDKAKVPIGIIAVTKQAPLIMHVSY